MKSKKPNILLITSDQQHYSTLGAVNKSIQTPALDSLCADGTLFTRAYCTNPTCTPSRASIITGTYPSQHGAWSLGTKLFEDVPTVGDKFQQNGYYTSLIGKAHFQPSASRPKMESIECHPIIRDLDFWRKFNGPWYGFEHIEIARMHTYEHFVGQHYAIWMEEKGLSNWRDYFMDWPDNPGKSKKLRASRSWNLPQEFHYSCWTAERTIAQIENAVSQDKPFFLWSSFHDPHWPYAVPEPWANMYPPQDMKIGSLSQGEHDNNPIHFGKTQENDASYWYKVRNGEPIHGAHCQVRNPEELRKDMACYYGMVSFMDQQIGRILDHLEKTGTADNTIIVFTTDHGHFLGQHGLTAKAIHHYEDLIRIPFIVKWKNRVSENSISSDIQNLVDLAPTFLEAAGLDIPVKMTGVSQVENWCEQKQVRTWSITENHHGTDCFHMRTYVNKRYKITVYHKGEEGELFDLEVDPGEINNLWNEPSALELKVSLLKEFMQATMACEPMLMPRIASA